MLCLINESFTLQLLFQIWGQLGYSCTNQKTQFFYTVIAHRMKFWIFVFIFINISPMQKQLLYIEIFFCFYEIKVKLYFIDDLDVNILYFIVNRHLCMFLIQMFAFTH